MALVAFGLQDVYLMASPQISYFKTIYKKNSINKYDTQEMKNKLAAILPFLELLPEGMFPMLSTELLDLIDIQNKDYYLLVMLKMNLPRVLVDILYNEYCELYLKKDPYHNKTESPIFGTKCNYSIARGMDYMNNMYLPVTLPSVNTAKTSTIADSRDINSNRSHNNKRFDRKNVHSRYNKSSGKMRGKMRVKFNSGR